MKKGFKLVSTFLVSFMIMMSSIMPAFADETDTSTTGDLLDKIQERGELIVGTSPDFLLMNLLIQQRQDKLNM